MTYIKQLTKKIIVMGLCMLFPLIPAWGLEQNLSVVLPSKPLTLETQIKEHIKEALIEHSEGDDFDITLLNTEEQLMEMFHQGGVDIRDAILINVGDKGRYVTASLRYHMFDGNEGKATLRARYEALVEVPVAAERLRRGDIISSDNITWKQVKSSRIKQGTLHDESDIIGKSPTRTLIPGRPIQRHMLSAPIMVHRQDKVWMVYQTSMVKLMATGVAMEDGSKDDLIAVKNISSGAVVHAIVSDGRYVMVPSVEGALGYEVAVNE